MLSVGLLDPAQQASRIRADAGQVGKRYSLPQAVQLGSQQLQVAALRRHHDRFPGRHTRLHIRENTSGVLSRGPVDERSVDEAIRVDHSCVPHYLTLTLPTSRLPGVPSRDRPAPGDLAWSQQKRTCRALATQTWAPVAEA